MLKLIALDDDDLKVVSAHLQDAIIREADIVYLPGEKKFVMMLNRFDWLTASEKRKQSSSFVRRRAVLRIDKVEKVQVQNISPGRGKRVMELLAVQFEPSEPPSGIINMVFAGEAGIRLTVECVEAELKDMEAAWHTRKMPHHPLGDDDAGGQTG